MNKKPLFYSGIFGPIAYLLNYMIGGIVTPNYSYIVNTVSEIASILCNLFKTNYDIILNNRT